MIFAYRYYEVLPTPGHPQHLIARPVIPVQVIGPAGKVVVMGLLDTGSDVTILPAFVLGLIGGKYASDEQARFRGVGGQVVTANYAEVELALDHPDGVCRWSVSVGFLDGRTVAILGQKGFLEYFNATFKSDIGRVKLEPNRQFPGKVEG